MSFSEINAGDKKVIGNIEFIVLEKFMDSALCLTKDLQYRRMKFGDNNNFRESSLYTFLNTEFFEKISSVVGAENIITTYIDLTSDDGLDDYLGVAAKFGLLTCEQYRKYNRIIEQYPVDGYWWLSTPFSTPHRGYDSYVRFVYDDGTLSYNRCSYDYGVRPFCIFSSSIF